MEIKCSYKILSLTIESVFISDKIKTPAMFYYHMAHSSPNCLFKKKERYISIVITFYYSVSPHGDIGREGNFLPLVRLFRQKYWFQPLLLLTIFKHEQDCQPNRMANDGVERLWVHLLPWAYKSYNYLQSIYLWGWTWRLTEKLVNS